MNFRSPTKVVPAVLGLLLLSAACTQDEPGSPGPDPTVTTTPAVEAEVYVAMGDSYVSAPLVPTTDLDDPCLRSTGNYPSLIAAQLGDTELIDVSCSGARSESLVGVQRVGQQVVPAQFDALSAETDLVTIGIGGNDGSLFSTLIGKCSSLPAVGGGGTPCRDAFQQGGRDRLLALVGKVEERIAAVVTGISDRSPEARVFVVGYPKLLPDEGTCPDLLPLATADYAYVDQINKGLTDALREGGIAAGAEYVDVYTASLGHDICSDEPWINGQSNDPDRALAFHPFVEEQEAVAAMILERLER